MSDYTELERGQSYRGSFGFADSQGRLVRWQQGMSSLFGLIWSASSDTVPLLLASRQVPDNITPGWVRVSPNLARTLEGIHKLYPLDQHDVLMFPSGDDFSASPCPDHTDMGLLLQPGCWIESKRFGLAVLVTVEDGWYKIRYEANHLATSTPLWVLNVDKNVKFKAPPDEKSKQVLAMEGPYGLGPGRSDPRSHWRDR